MQCGDSAVQPGKVMVMEVMMGASEKRWRSGEAEWGRREYEVEDWRRSGGQDAGEELRLL